MWHVDTDPVGLWIAVGERTERRQAHSRYQNPHVLQAIGTRSASGQAGWV